MKQQNNILTNIQICFKTVLTEIINIEILFTLFFNYKVSVV